MRLSHYFVFGLVCLLNLASSPAKAEKAEIIGAGYDIIIVAGQSNAVGYGCGPFTDVDTQHDQRIFQLLPDQRVVSAEEPLVHAYPRVGRGGKGFGMTFARLYAAGLSRERKVLLVPVGMGATSIIQWDNVNEDIDFDPPFGKHGLPMRYDTTELYDTLLRQTRAALAFGSVKNRNRIAALLWHQGETDFMFMHLNSGKPHETMPNIPAYTERLVKLMKLLRSELQAGGANWPVVVGEIGEYLPIPGAPVVSEFNRALYSAAQLIGGAAVVSADRLFPGSTIRCSFGDNPQFPDGDPYHINSAGQVEFGRRYFKAFQGIQSERHTST
jgi:hypothetical protein